MAPQGAGIPEAEEIICFLLRPLRYSAWMEIPVQSCRIL